MWSAGGAFVPVTSALMRDIRHGKRWQFASCCHMPPARSCACQRRWHFTEKDAHQTSGQRRAAGTRQHRWEGLDSPWQAAVMVALIVARQQRYDCWILCTHCAEKYIFAPRQTGDTGAAQQGGFGRLPLLPGARPAAAAYHRSVPADSPGALLQCEHCAVGSSSRHPQTVTHLWTRCQGRMP